MKNSKSNFEKTAAGVTTGTVAKVVMYGKKKSRDIYDGYETQFEKCEQLTMEVNELTETVRTKIAPRSDEKGGKQKRLKSVQLTSFRRQLAEKKAELKKEKATLKKLSGTYLRVNRNNQKAARQRVMSMNQVSRYSRLAMQNKDELWGRVKTLIHTLSQKKDPRITLLSQSAKVNGLQFYNALFKIVRTEFNGTEALNMLKASGQVRNEIFKSVRMSFGYQPKR